VHFEAQLFFIPLNSFSRLMNLGLFKKLETRLFLSENPAEYGVQEYPNTMQPSSIQGLIISIRTREYP